MHAYILCLREQLRESAVKVVELFPPAVQTELHDEKHQPNIKNGRQIGIPLEQFTNEAYKGLAAGKEEVVVGVGQDWYNKIEPARQEFFHGMVKMMRQRHD
ncbi:hypothetical protein IMSHALPRED_007318 [Imshaugia aleurites]|uniref:Uncharacterized protein n=1 Tax=Imshaugia aleurites TaxID=172621 RepID=A0A8H3FR53_9LECA|nr:hypothetical protein IMSHALPRED_007318 [Imshaugia aleurites]